MAKHTQMSSTAKGANAMIVYVMMILWAVTTLSFIVGMFIAAQPTVENRGTFWFLMVVGVFVIYSLLWPLNWYFVPNRFAAAVYRMGQIDEEARGEGLIHVFWPLESVRKGPLFDLTGEITIVIPLSGETPQNVRIRFLRNTRFLNVVKTLQAVPDRDPVKESDDLIIGDVMQAFYGRDVASLKNPNTIRELNDAANANIESNETLKRWGVISRITLKDVNPPKSMLRAAARIIEAEGEADAERLQAKARKDAILDVGEQLYASLEWIEAIRTSGITTFVSLGDEVSRFFRGVGGQS